MFMNTPPVWATAIRPVADPRSPLHRLKVPRNPTPRTHRRVVMAPGWLANSRKKRPRETTGPATHLSGKFDYRSLAVSWHSIFLFPLTLCAILKVQTRVCVADAEMGCHIDIRWHSAQSVCK